MVVVVIPTFQAWDSLVFFFSLFRWASPNARVLRPFRAWAKN